MVHKTSLYPVTFSTNMNANLFLTTTTWSSNPTYLSKFKYRKRKLISVRFHMGLTSRLRAAKHGSKPLCVIQRNAWFRKEAQGANLERDHYRSPLEDASIDSFWCKRQSDNHTHRMFFSGVTPYP